jgi:5-methylcytosine-specific restriction endonuclease McrA
MALSTWARRAVLARDHAVCALCGTTGKSWEADHVVPLVLGGSHDLSNYRTLCLGCHKAETAKLARTRSRRGRQTEIVLPEADPIR